MRCSSCGAVARPVALLVALLVARAVAYTVDCNQDYADCEKELSKLSDDEPHIASPSNRSTSDVETEQTTETKETYRKFTPVTTPAVASELTDKSALQGDHNENDFGNEHLDRIDVLSTYPDNLEMTEDLVDGKRIENSDIAKHKTDHTVRIDTPYATTENREPTSSNTEMSTIENKAEKFPTESVEPYRTDKIEKTTKPSNAKGRLLNLSVDDLQSFVNALHNHSTDEEGAKVKEPKPDLSDVSLDADEDFVFSPHGVVTQDARILNKDLPNTFYSNLQQPFGKMKAVELERSDESDSCVENGMHYRAGEKMERGCEESCECAVNGQWECSPRCRQPYIRRGRRLKDPLCFETPVDECCSIIACATGNDPDMKVSASTNQKMEVCRYGNKTYTSGQTWEIGCEQICSCEPNSIVTCKPRCTKLSPSDHCINVQDPNDACCQVQVCDVTHDAHEGVDTPAGPSSNPTTMEDRMDSDFNDLLASTTVHPIVTSHREPVSSVTVFNNQTVLVNLFSSNRSNEQFHLQISSNNGDTYHDVTLNSANMITNLESGSKYFLRIKETGKTFEFMIPAETITNYVTNDVEPYFNRTTIQNTTAGSLSTTTGEMGCISDGVHYKIGEEFHIGCSELCECVGPNQKECAALECPSHVGLELVSPSCVRWAPDPPDWKPISPACCPTKMRCLSDGSCNYHGHKIPNWSEVPVSLTGCEQRCFCESGTLDCQNICSPLPDLPPQTLRCQPGFKPAPVNISEDDCCKQWGCVSIAGPDAPSPMHSHSHSMPHTNKHNQPINYVTPVPPPTTMPSTFIPTVLPEKPSSTDSLESLRKLIPEIKPLAMYSKYMRHPNPLLKMNPSLSGNGDFQMHPKRHSINFTKSITHVPSVPYRFPESLDNFMLLKPVSNLDFGAKASSANKDMGVTMMNHVHVDHTVPVPTHTEKPKHPKIAADPLDFRHGASNRPSKTSLASPIHMKGENKNVYRYFEPNMNVTSYILPHSKPVLLPQSINVPNVNVTSFNLPHSKPVLLSNTDSREVSITQQSVHVPSKLMKLLPDRHHPSSYPDVSFVIPEVTNNVSLDRKTHYSHQSRLPVVQNSGKNIHILQRAPNPYQSVLHRFTSPKSPSVIDYKYDLDNYNAMRDLHSTYSPLDVGELLKQLEKDSLRSRHMTDRGIDNNMTPDSRPTDQHDFAQGSNKLVPPSFLPTIPPENHFSAEEDLGGYDSTNNIHHPPIGQPKPPPNFNLPSLPPSGFPQESQDNKKLSVISLAADSPTSVKMLFGLPSVLVGLRGSVDLRYTDKDDEDVSHWYSQVFAPADEILTTARLEFRLTGLKPSTMYKLRGKLYLHNLPLEPVSSIYSVRTLDLVQMEEKRRAVDSQITVIEVNATVAHIAWRHFNEDELKFIDGIQVRYRPLEQPIYTMTELLHHGRSSVELRELRPGSQYEASLVLVPPPRSPLELFDPKRINFTTPEFYDMYNWSVTVEAHSLGSGSVELRWRGVPAPPERYVRVYRAAHTCDTIPRSPHREHDAFKLADRDQPPNILISGLEPNTKCRVWLELFLTNGKVKISNVLDITTKTEDVHSAIDNEIQASSVAGSRSGPRSDYYGALVVVGVVAALGALTSLLLLLVVVRRHRPHSVPITPVPSAPRATSLPPYDNPAYKLELQQETMDL